jgi:hypothetical protein
MEPVRAAPGPAVPGPSGVSGDRGGKRGPPVHVAVHDLRTRPHPGAAEWSGDAQIVGTGHSGQFTSRALSIVATARGALPGSYEP